MARVGSEEVVVELASLVRKNVISDFIDIQLTRSVPSMTVATEFLTVLSVQGGCIKQLKRSLRG